MEHRCRRGEYCPDYEKVDGQKLGRQINATDGICDTCARHVERAIAELPVSYTRLNAMLGHGSTAGGEPVRMTRELPIPIRVHVEALQREIVTETDAWAASVADVIHVEWTPAGGVRPGWTLDRACHLLLASQSVLLALRDVKHVLWEGDQRYVAVRDGLDGALSLLRLQHRVRIVLGAARLVHCLPVPCPRCEAMALEREDGTESIDCTDCGTRYTWDEYEHLCLCLVDREERRVNVA